MVAKPLVGITATVDDGEGVRLGRDYVRAVEAAGGLPVVLAPAGVGALGAYPAVPANRGAGENADEWPGEWVREIVGRIHALVFSGGVDIDPALFGEEPIPGLGVVTPERDRFEVALARQGMACGLPMLGICRGTQVLSVAAGGTLYQDLGSQLESSLKHRQEGPRWYGSHGVRVAEGSVLAEVTGTTEFRVNSFHHQAVRDPGQGLRAVAWAPDGVIEAIEKTGPVEGAGFLLGVQWHPEAMWDRDPLHLRLFQALVKAARHYAGTI